MALEVEDDVFFADISRQIALLIMDDEESFPVQRQSVPVQEFPYFPRTITTPTYNYDIPYKSKGTGVFIPKSTIPRRKSKSSKPNSTNNGNYVQHYKPTPMVSGVAINENNRILSSFYGNSSVPKRHF